jgi:hypothetical protein
VALVGSYSPGRLGRQDARRRHSEIAALLAWPELAHARRLRFTSPRQAAGWLAGLGR